MYKYRDTGQICSIMRCMELIERLLFLKYCLMCLLLNINNLILKVSFEIVAFSALILFCHIPSPILINIKDSFATVPKCIINTINVSLIPLFCFQWGETFAELRMTILPNFRLITVNWESF